MGPFSTFLFGGSIISLFFQGGSVCVRDMPRQTEMRRSTKFSSLMSRTPPVGLRLRSFFFFSSLFLWYGIGVLCLSSNSRVEERGILLLMGWRGVNAIGEDTRMFCEELFILTAHGPARGGGEIGIRVLSPSFPPPPLSLLGVVLFFGSLEEYIRRRLTKALATKWALRTLDAL